jgi:hypothetical protein
MNAPVPSRGTGADGLPRPAIAAAAKAAERTNDPVPALTGMERDDTRRTHAE